MTVPSRQADEALDRLIDYAGWATTPKPHKDAVATVRSELRQLREERDAWMDPFDGSGVEWHEGLPNPYTYQASDFSKLVSAVHEYECHALAAEAEVRRLTEGLRETRGHNDTCDMMLGDSKHPYPCSCGHHELRSALARLDSGAAEDARTSSEGGRNQEHLSSAKAAPSPDPEDSGAAEGDA